MDFNNITIGEAKQIAALIGTTNTVAPGGGDPFTDKYVICRCHSAGVHAGEMVHQQGDVVLLRDSRRLWSWKANAGVALSGVAQHGLALGSKVDVLNPLIRLTGVVETILCSAQARDSIRGA